MNSLNNPQHVIRAFRIYQKLAKRERWLEDSRPGGRFGIAVHDDPAALEWQQQIAWRIEVVSAFLLGQRPNPWTKRWYMPKKENAA